MLGRVELVLCVVVLCAFAYSRSQKLDMMNVLGDIEIAQELAKKPDRPSKSTAALVRPRVPVCVCVCVRLSVGVCVVCGACVRACVCVN